MNLQNLIKKLQIALNEKGESLTVDGVYGPKTRSAAHKYNIEKISINAIDRVVVKVEEPKKKTGSIPWFHFSKKYSGKHETDPEFSRFMVPQWKKLGLDLNTIATNWSAWCGLAIAVSFIGVGLDYQKNGATAKNWDKFGQEIKWDINGIPQGAIVRLNSRADCKSASGNHVSMANGDCSPSDLKRPNATIDLYGGNQGNTWKVSTYRVSTICSVRWPKDHEQPSPVLRSKNCARGKPDNESTR